MFEPYYSGSYRIVLLPYTGPNAIYFATIAEEGDLLGTSISSSSKSYSFVNGKQYTIEVSALWCSEVSEYIVVISSSLGGESVSVRFDANGGTSSQYSQYYDVGGSYTFLPTAEWQGHHFDGWYTARTGGIQISSLSTVCMGYTTLYAHWDYEDLLSPYDGTIILGPSTYKVAFNANGGKGKMTAQTLTYGTATKLRKNTFTRSGYVFIGWATTKGGAVKYKNAQSVKNLRTDGKTTTLYAKWAKKNYKVAFYANGGKLPKGKKMPAQTMTYGKAKKLTANKFKRKGYTFKGWAKSKALAQKGTVTYRNKQAVKNLVTNGKTVKLYAVWKKK